MDDPSLVIAVFKVLSMPQPQNGGRHIVLPSAIRPCVCPSI